MSRDELQEYAINPEIVGGMAIVAFLIFIDTQLQQNTIATQGNTLDELISADQGYYFDMEAWKNGNQ